MSTTIAISRLEVYTGDGIHDTTLFEVRVEEDQEFLQDIQLSSAKELITLRDALTSYINDNNLANEY